MSHGERTSLEESRAERRALHEKVPFRHSRMYKCDSRPTTAGAVPSSPPLNNVKVLGKATASARQADTSERKAGRFDPVKYFRDMAKAQSVMPGKICDLKLDGTGQANPKKRDMPLPRIDAAFAEEKKTWSRALRELLIVHSLGKIELEFRKKTLATKDYAAGHYVRPVFHCSRCLELYTRHGILSCGCDETWTPAYGPWFFVGPATAKFVASLISLRTTTTRQRRSRSYEHKLGPSASKAMRHFLSPVRLTPRLRMEKRRPHDGSNVLVDYDVNTDFGQGDELEDISFRTILSNEKQPLEENGGTSHCMSNGRTRSSAAITQLNDENTFGFRIDRADRNMLSTKEQLPPKSDACVQEKDRQKVIGAADLTSLSFLKEPKGTEAAAEKPALSVSTASISERSAASNRKIQQTTRSQGGAAADKMLQAVQAEAKKMPKTTASCNRPPAKMHSDGVTCSGSLRVLRSQDPVKGEAGTVALMTKMPDAKPQMQSADMNEVPSDLKRPMESPNSCLTEVPSAKPNDMDRSSPPELCSARDFSGNDYGNQLSDTSLEKTMVAAVASIFSKFVSDVLEPESAELSQLALSAPQKFSLVYQHMINKQLPPKIEEEVAALVTKYPQLLVYAAESNFDLDLQSVNQTVIANLLKGMLPSQQRRIRGEFASKSIEEPTGSQERKQHPGISHDRSELVDAVTLLVPTELSNKDCIDTCRHAPRGHTDEAVSEHVTQTNQGAVVAAFDNSLDGAAVSNKGNTNHENIKPRLSTLTAETRNAQPVKDQSFSTRVDQHSWRDETLRTGHGRSLLHTVSDHEPGAAIQGLTKRNSSQGSRRAMSLESIEGSRTGTLSQSAASLARGFSGEERGSSSAVPLSTSSAEAPGNASWYSSLFSDSSAIPIEATAVISGGEPSIMNGGNDAANGPGQLTSTDSRLDSLDETTRALLANMYGAEELAAMSREQLTKLRAYSDFLVKCCGPGIAKAHLDRRRLAKLFEYFGTMDARQPAENDGDTDDVAATAGPNAELLHAYRYSLMYDKMLELDPELFQSSDIRSEAAFLRMLERLHADVRKLNHPKLVRLKKLFNEINVDVHKYSSSVDLVIEEGLEEIRNLFGDDENVHVSASLFSDPEVIGKSFLEYLTAEKPSEISRRSSWYGEETEEAEEDTAAKEENDTVPELPVFREEQENCAARGAKIVSDRKASDAAEPEKVLGKSLKSRAMHWKKWHKKPSPPSKSAAEPTKTQAAAIQPNADVSVAESNTSAPAQSRDYAADLDFKSGSRESSIGRKSAQRRISRSRVPSRDQSLDLVLDEKVQAPVNESDLAPSVAFGKENSMLDLFDKMKDVDDDAEQERKSIDRPCDKSTSRYAIVRRLLHLKGMIDFIKRMMRNREQTRARCLWLGIRLGINYRRLFDTLRSLSKNKRLTTVQVKIFASMLGMSSKDILFFATECEDVSKVLFGDRQGRLHSSAPNDVRSAHLNEEPPLLTPPAELTAVPQRVVPVITNSDVVKYERSSETVGPITRRRQTAQPTEDVRLPPTHLTKASSLTASDPFSRKCSARLSTEISDGQPPELIRRGSHKSHEEDNFNRRKKFDISMWNISVSSSICEPGNSISSTGDSATQRRLSAINKGTVAAAQEEITPLTENRQRLGKHSSAAVAAAAVKSNLAPKTEISEPPKLSTSAGHLGITLDERVNDLRIPTYINDDWLSKQQLEEKTRDSPTPRKKEKYERKITVSPEQVAPVEETRSSFPNDKSERDVHGRQSLAPKRKGDESVRKPTLPVTATARPTLSRSPAKAKLRRPKPRHTPSTPPAQRIQTASPQTARAEAIEQSPQWDADKASGRQRRKSSAAPKAGTHGSLDKNPALTKPPASVRVEEPSLESMPLGKGTDVEPPPPEANLSSEKPHSATSLINLCGVKFPKETLDKINLLSADSAKKIEKIVGGMLLPSADPEKRVYKKKTVIREKKDDKLIPNVRTTWNLLSHINIFKNLPLMQGMPTRRPLSFSETVRSIIAAPHENDNDDMPVTESKESHTSSKHSDSVTANTLDDVENFLIGSSTWEVTLDAAHDHLSIITKHGRRMTIPQHMFKDGHEKRTTFQKRLHQIVSILEHSSSPQPAVVVKNTPDDNFEFSPFEYNVPELPPPRKTTNAESTGRQQVFQTKTMSSRRQQVQPPIVTDNKQSLERVISGSLETTAELPEAKCPLWIYEFDLSEPRLTRAWTFSYYPKHPWQCKYNGRVWADISGM